MREIGAVLLAAGRGTRFGGKAEDTKLTADFGGKPLVRHAVEAALASKARPIVAVTGHSAAKVAAALDGLDVFPVHNPAFAEGLASSLKAGVAALPDRVAGVIILLADMPFVSAAVIDRLIAQFEQAEAEPDGIVPVRNGQRGNPVLIGRRLFSQIAKLQGDRGARALLQASTHVLECPIEDAAVEIDIDTPETLAAFNRLTVPGSPNCDSS